MGALFFNVKEATRKANESLTGSGHGNNVAESSGCGDGAEASQGLDPARSVAMHGELLIVGGGIPVIFAPLEHEEDSAHPSSTDFRLKLLIILRLKYMMIR
jgi:hypothetical protein